MVCEAGLSIATVTTDPSAPNEIHLSNDTDITLSLRRNQLTQSAVCLIAQSITSLISQHSLPFFDDNCKRDSDDASKSIMIISIMAEMILIRQMTTNGIDAGQ